MKKYIILLLLSSILSINALYQPTFSDKLEVLQFKLNNNQVSFNDVKDLVSSPGVDYMKLLGFLYNNWSAIVRNIRNMAPGGMPQTPKTPQAQPNKESGFQIPQFLKDLYSQKDTAPQANQETTGGFQVPDFLKDILAGSEATTDKGTSSPKPVESQESNFKIPDFLKNVLGY